MVFFMICPKLFKGVIELLIGTDVWQESERVIVYACLSEYESVLVFAARLTLYECMKARDCFVYLSMILRK